MMQWNRVEAALKDNNQESLSKLKSDILKECENSFEYLSNQGGTIKKLLLNTFRYSLEIYNAQGSTLDLFTFKVNILKDFAQNHGHVLYEDVSDIKIEDEVLISVKNGWLIYDVINIDKSYIYLKHKDTEIRKGRNFKQFVAGVSKIQAKKKSKTILFLFT